MMSLDNETVEGALKIISYYSFAVLIYLAVFYDQRTRLSIFIFLFFTLTVSIFESYILDTNFKNYYILCASLDLFMIILIRLSNHPTKAMSSIQAVCEAFIYINLFGFILHQSNNSYLYYNTACAILFVVLAVLMNRNRPKDVDFFSRLRSNNKRIYHDDSDFLLQPKGYKTEASDQ